MGWVHAHRRARPLATRPHLHFSREALAVARARLGRCGPAGRAHPPALRSGPGRWRCTAVLGKALRLQIVALRQMAVTSPASGQVRARAGTAGTGFDVLHLAVRCGLGDWPDEVYGHLLESQASPGGST